MTDTTPHLDTRPVTVPMWAFERFMSRISADKSWTHDGDPLLGEAFNVLAAAKDAALGHGPAEPAGPAEPPLPPGKYARAELRDGRVLEGWASDGVLAGAPCLDLHHADGQLLAKIPPGSIGAYFPLFPPSPAGLPVSTGNFYPRDDEPAVLPMAHVEPGEAS